MSFHVKVTHLSPLGEHGRPFFEIIKSEKGHYETLEEAQEASRNLEFQSEVTYTREILGWGRPVFSRYLLVYLGVDLTLEPGLYPLPLHDFFVIEKSGYEVRLPTYEELDETSSSPRRAIPVHPGKAKSLHRTLDLLEVSFRLEGEPDQTQVLTQLVPELYYYLVLNDENNTRDLLRTIYPEASDGGLELLTEVLVKFLEELEGLREVGTSPSVYSEKIIEYRKKYSRTFDGLWAALVYC